MNDKDMIEALTNEVDCLQRQVDGLREANVTLLNIIRKDYAGRKGK